ncbi:programmed cell death protein 2-like [Asterias amurensis]|uniref:programmed cell death protein 2-like n=1 Tax=Asterias amurensis TaxID=7602 RepID=UPI003AB7BAEC
MAAPVGTEAHTLIGICDEKIEASHVTSWQCNKLGGYPDWMCLNSQVEPICAACRNTLRLVTQLYCPLEGSQYHRTLYIFTCIAVECLNKQTSWRVIRCQLPVTKLLQENAEKEQEETPQKVAMATEDWCDDADDWGSGSDGESDPISCLATPLTENQVMSSSSATTKHDDSEGCSVAMTTRPSTNMSTNERIEKPKNDLKLSTHDKVVDMHSIGQPTNDKTNSAMEAVHDDVINDVMKNLSITTETTEKSSSVKDCLDVLSFKPFYVSVFDEPSSSSMAPELTNHARELMLNYQQREGVNVLDWQEQSLQLSSVSAGSDEVYEKTTAKHGDRFYQKFSKKLQLCPEQCIRYSWNGRPLYITSPSEGSIIPACPYCSGERVFEVQLMPPIISVLKTTTSSDISLDFGIVMIYTCKRSCWNEPCQPGQFLYREEHVILQADPDSSLINQATFV